MSVLAPLHIYIHTVIHRDSTHSMRHLPPHTRTPGMSALKSLHIFSFSGRPIEQCKRQSHRSAWHCKLRMKCDACILHRNYAQPTCPRFLLRENIKANTCIVVYNTYRIYIPLTPFALTPILLYTPNTSSCFSVRVSRSVETHCRRCFRYLPSSPLSLSQVSLVQVLVACYPLVLWMSW